ncbi:MAG: hypothetical protein ACREPU_14295 [Rhodanobacteraceae bacterium]
MNGDWYAGVRVLHILAAALWIGTTALLTFFVSPAIRGRGPRGAPVMVELMRRRMGLYIAVASGVTILSGLWLYWIFTAGFDLGVIASPSGLIFGIGALCGIVAPIIGGAVIGRSAERIAKVARKATQLADGAERNALMGDVAILQRRVATFSRIDVLLLVAALVLMSLGHYV